MLQSTEFFPTMDTLRTKQLDLLEALLDSTSDNPVWYEHLPLLLIVSSNAHFIVEEQYFYCVAGMLANASPYFQTLLYGGFREASSSDPITIEGVKKVGFRCVVRFCYGLDPQLNGQNVVATVKAAEMFGMSVLKDMCDLFMSTGKALVWQLANTTGVTASNVLDVYSSLLDSALSLELELRFWTIICEKPTVVLDSDAFLRCDLRIVQQLVKCESFDVSEERLWQQCLAAFNDNRESLRSLIPDFRFCLMSPEFFADNVRHHLLKDESEDVLLAFLLKRKSKFPSAHRHKEEEATTIPFEVVAASVESDKAKLLSQGTSDWSRTTNFPQWFEVEFPRATHISNIVYVV